MTANVLLRQLPPFKGHEDIIVRGPQSLDDIIDQVLVAHKQCAGQYDLLVPFFDVPNPLQALFSFCVDELPYNAESGKYQTTRTPAGILQLSQTIGVDCKHYAGFIAGMIDALNRAGLANYSWCYRFASYADGKPCDHVFVVVKSGSKETWLDPAPIYLTKSKNFLSRSFNDRLAIPVLYIDEKPLNMMAHLSGISDYYVTDDGTDSTCAGSRVGLFSKTDLLDVESAPVSITPMEPRILIPQSPIVPVLEPAPSPQTSDIMSLTDTVQNFLSTGAQAASAVPEVAAVQQTADQVASVLPDGGLKTFLHDLTHDPGSAIIRLIKGRKYTSGDYALGEMYLRNILGMSNIQSRQQVDDKYVPQAHAFFTAALGVPIGSSDHLDALAKSPEAYQQWIGSAMGQIPDAQKDRAFKILQALGYSPNPASVRNVVWSLPTFASIPYIYPLLDVDAKGYFTGTHPITGLKIQNGYPVGQASTPTPMPPLQGSTSGGATADQLAYLQNYLGSIGTVEERPKRLWALTQLTPQEQAALYTIIHDYFNTGTAVPGTLQPVWDKEEQLAASYTGSTAPGGTVPVPSPGGNPLPAPAPAPGGNIQAGMGTLGWVTLGIVLLGGYALVTAPDKKKVRKTR